MKEVTTSKEQTDHPPSDLKILVNCLLYFVENEALARSKLEGPNSESCLFRDSEKQLLYLLNVQLTNKLRKLSKQGQSIIDEYIPTGEKNQKIWYLELLDSQLATAESTTSKLIRFVQ